MLISRPRSTKPLVTLLVCCWRLSHVLIQLREVQAIQASAAVINRHDWCRVRFTCRAATSTVSRRKPLQAHANASQPSDVFAQVACRCGGAQGALCGGVERDAPPQDHGELGRGQPVGRQVSRRAVWGLETEPGWGDRTRAHESLVF